METNNNSSSRSEGKPGEDGRQDRPRRTNRFSRRKVCPFIMDKTLVLDYKNMKVINRFVTETGKIVPRHVSGVSAKNQRKLSKHIKRARALGFVAPLIAE
ncbi:30S ribosomal protein S18 [bacterium]|nr:30S ribosomal protein S18 [bacterium]